MKPKASTHRPFRDRPIEILCELEYSEDHPRCPQVEALLVMIHKRQFRAWLEDVPERSNLERSTLDLTNRGDLR